MLATTNAAGAANAGTTVTRNNSGVASSNQPIQLSDLQKYLSNLTQPTEGRVTAPPNGKFKKKKMSLM